MHAQVLLPSAYVGGMLCLPDGQKRPDTGVLSNKQTDGPVPTFCYTPVPPASHAIEDGEHACMCNTKTTFTAAKMPGIAWIKHSTPHH